MIHVSTDYVFNGEYYLPISEEDEVNPIGIYGITKREGEVFVINSSLEGVVIRTSWLYSSYGNNFVKTMLRLGAEREQLNVIFDQIGTSTYAADLTKVILKMIHSKNLLDKQSKIYHFSNEGVASWYDFAIVIMELGNIDCKINPVRTKEYPTPAKRPCYSVLDKSKIKKDFGIKIPYWRDSLRECIKHIQFQKD